MGPVGNSSPSSYSVQSLGLGMDGRTPILSFFLVFFLSECVYCAMLVLYVM
jgi:hypothetical protein